MKYFIDFEFIEGFRKPWFGKRYHFIDMISVGIYAEDGRAYHALSEEYNYKDADNWVREKVIIPLYQGGVHGDARNAFKVDNFHKHYGKPNKQIVAEIVAFINEGLTEVIEKITRCDCWNEKYYPKEFKYIKDHNTLVPNSWYSSGVDGKGYERNAKIIYNQPEFYGYFSDYDWVLFCSLFGRMIDLPKGFPYYCIDLKQTMDEKAAALTQIAFTKMIVSNTSLNWKVKGPIDTDIIDISSLSLSSRIELIKAQKDYPKNDQEHSAVADAKWNYDLYKFLQKF